MPPNIATLSICFSWYSWLLSYHLSKFNITNIKIYFYKSDIMAIWLGKNFRVKLTCFVHKFIAGIFLLWYK